MTGETLFLSRAGADAAISEVVAGVLERAGYDVILQQRSFINKNFIHQMQTALASGARVIALLSPDYLESDYCSAEWQSVLADDPLNKNSRLVVLRIAPCAPAGLLKALVYWDLVAAQDPKLFESTILEAVALPGTPSLQVPVQRVPVLPAVTEPSEFGSAAHNLPPQLTAFIGRARVLAEIKVIVETARLVTLLGPGGLGKTRTALQVAADLHDGTGDGVWFVDLAPIATAFVVAQLASVFDVREETGKPLLESVLASLQPKRLLLILDNCEHVIDAARDVADAIVRRCPDVRIIATTREALGVEGEAVYRLPALGVPLEGENLTAESALRYEAVAMFVARARAADSRFSITDANAVTVAEICRRLDGIALAIELAAPRIKILNLTQLAAKLSERFRLLTGGGKTSVPRQQTMRALIDWSYDLLDTGEQRLFRRLAIFSGGWTLEAATAVCGGDDADEFEILDRLTSLSDKSLVVVEFSEEEAKRFRLLESMRAYGIERMRDAGEVEELARGRAAFFAQNVGEGPEIGTAMLARLAAIEPEIDNLREVLTWALQERHDVQLGARLALALGRFWSTQLPREGQRWLELARDALGEDPNVVLRANLQTALAAVLAHGSFERFDATERALALARAADDPRTLSRAFAAYGEQLTPRSRLDEAEAAFEGSLESARAIASERDAARALAGLGMVALDRDNVEAAREYGHQAIVIFEALGAIDGVAYVSIALGQAEFRAGDLERAVALTRRARSAYGELNNNRSSACAANYLAAFALEVDNFEEARVHARDTLALLRTDPHPLFLTEAIGHLAFLATISGDPARGSLLQGYVGAAFHRIAHSRGTAIEPCYQRHERLLGETLDAETLRLRLAEGASLSESRAMEVALTA